MFLMVTQTYPTKSVAAVGKVAMGVLAKALPPYVKRLGPYIAAGGDGIKSYSLYEIEKGQVEEGIKEVNKRLVAFFNIEGWKYTLEPLMTAEEALPLIGL